MEFKPKTIGIVGGAAPLAGVYMLEQLFKHAMSKYGCHRDSDFPKVILLSFPFSEMLVGEVDSPLIQKELSGCLMQLRQNGAMVLAIACNTLHAFLDEKEDPPDVINLARTTGAKVSSLYREGLKIERPLVLCSSTSAKFGVHKKFFPCTYPDQKTQETVDQIIDLTLKEGNQKAPFSKLIGLVESQSAQTIVLGCTELSLFTKKLIKSKKMIIDPIEIVVNKLLEISFSK